MFSVAPIPDQAYTSLDESTFKGEHMKHALLFSLLLATTAHAAPMTVAAYVSRCDRIEGDTTQVTYLIGEYREVNLGAATGMAPIASAGRTGDLVVNLVRSPAPEQAELNATYTDKSGRVMKSKLTFTADVVSKAEAGVCESADDVGSLSIILAVYPNVTEE